MTFKKTQNFVNLVDTLIQKQLFNMICTCLGKSSKQNKPAKIFALLAITTRYVLKCATAV